MSKKIANPNLPQEILMEIFLRLPAKSIGKCRCLSKTWNTRLSTSQFINLHLKTRKTHDLIILTESGSLHIVNCPLKKDDKIVFSRSIQSPLDGWTRVLGSCNGLLLLLQAKTRKMFVLNPITRQRVRIPNPPSVGEIILYGFGYGSSCDDFKVVTLTYQRINNHVDVYCMKTRVWKTIAYRFGFSIHSRMVMPFVNGALHWFTNTDPYSLQSDRICAFDLATESFHQIPLPMGFKPVFSLDGLVVLRGCLANVGIFPDRSTDVWVMNEYGVGDSWVRFHINGEVMPSLIRPMCFVGDEEMLCVTGSKCWAVYDLKEGMWKKMGDGPVPYSFTDWMVFEDSLVSP